MSSGGTARGPSHWRGLLGGVWRDPSGRIGQRPRGAGIRAEAQQKRGVVLPRLLFISGLLLGLLILQAPRIFGNQTRKLDMGPIHGSRQPFLATHGEPAEPKSRQLMEEGSALQWRRKEMKQLGLLQETRNAVEALLPQPTVGARTVGAGKSPGGSKRGDAPLEREAPLLRGGDEGGARGQGTGKGREEEEEGGGHRRALREEAAQAWEAGEVALRELESYLAEKREVERRKERGESEGEDSQDAEKVTCSASIYETGDALRAMGNLVVLPCGMTMGSSITLTATMATETGEEPHGLKLELQGLRGAGGEAAARIFHLNPRLRGDWSGRPVLEANTCFRGQWGAAQRCEGAQAGDDEETVDGLRRCEKWSRSEHSPGGPATSSGWLSRLTQRSSGEDLEWPFPFARARMFVLTVRAGWEGFHVSVDGLHVMSFPYRTGFAVEEATGVFVEGDLVVHSLAATSLPPKHPASPAVLEFSESLRAPPLKEGPISMYIGILSTCNHFEERLAVRKTWMQYPQVREGDVVARFFLAMHPTKEVNAEVRRESELYGDMVVLPFVDRYDLLVLKTVALQSQGVATTQARFLMKVDDDTFVRVGPVLEKVLALGFQQGMYAGNMNDFHKPLREGKWAVSKEEWPEETYPPYANGPGYVVTRDISEYIATMHNRGSLQIFKMEDVSMGMYVIQFGRNHTLHYVHDLRFCQYGCMDNYLTAHYQSPRQMMCLWEKLSNADSSCCNY